MAGDVPTDELRTLFLFESLTDPQLQWLADRGESRTYDAGATVFREGEPAEHLYVLLDGGLRMLRRSVGEDVTVNETTQRGAYSGAIRSYVDSAAGNYANSVLTTEPSRFFRLPAEDFATLMRTFFPMAVHLLDGLYVGVRNTEATIQQREHLAQLGTLSANLAHELNNPAAAAVRATGQLRERVAAMRDVLAEGELDSAALGRLAGLQAAALAASTAAPAGAMAEADREDALIDRLEELAVPGAYELAPVFAAAGLSEAWLDGLASEPALPVRLRWLAAALETAALLDEIEDATGRISALVSAVRQYSYLDAGSVQEVDLHAGLESTLVMLGHKLRGVRIERDYDRTLPPVPVRGAALNQVWTNLIANAADAMAGGGVLRLRTARDGEHALVQIGDTGPGIAPEVLPRVFDAFFTTKAPGEGTGLGLDNARRIVVTGHRGQIDVTSTPAGTTFSVRLPLVQRLA